MKSIVYMVIGVLAFLFGHVTVSQTLGGEIVNRDPATQTQPRNFCMFSALINGMEGEVFEQERDEVDAGCEMYMCAIILDSDGKTYEYEVLDCGEGLHAPQVFTEF